MIFGYASKAQMARLASMYHLQSFEMGITPWHEWVPSKANIADEPSRDRRSPEAFGWPGLTQLGAERVEMVFLSPELWDDIGLWLVHPFRG